MKKITYGGVEIAQDLFNTSFGPAGRTFETIDICYGDDSVGPLYRERLGDEYTQWSLSFDEHEESKGNKDPCFASLDAGKKRAEEFIASLVKRGKLEDNDKDNGR